MTPPAGAALVLNDATTTIPDDAMGHNKAITSISGSGVTDIGVGAFFGCTGLTSVSLPNVMNISGFAFQRCTSLTSITLPISLQTMGRGVFGECTDLTKIEIAFGNARFMSDSGVLYNDYQTELIAYPAGKTDTYYTAPETVTTVYVGAFRSCTGLKSVSLPNVTTIEGGAFHGCTSLKSVSLPNVTTIEAGAFRQCTNLTSVSLPKVTTIWDGAFAYCTGLTSVSLPNVTTIRNIAFFGCTNLTSVTIQATAPPTLGTDAFSYSNGTSDVPIPNLQIKVPAGSVNDYRTTTTWLPYASQIIAIPSGSSGGDTGGGTPSAPSSVTTPTGVSTTIGGTKYPAEKQPDGTYLITVPNGTDISNLPVNVGLPTGATSVPKMPTSHNFTKGPLEVTITAQDGKTKATYTVKVQVESPVGPTEKPLFTIGVTDCEIIVTQNTDGTLAVKVRIPFASGSNPALLDTVRMIASSLGLSNVSYSYVDAQGNETPVTPRAGAKAPYLQIAGTAANMDAIKNGVISKIEYTLKGDNTTYVQTFAGGGLKIASMPGYPTTPTPAPSTGGGSGGCDAGMAGLAAVALAGMMAGKRKK